MATLIIGHGEILNAPTVLEKASGQASSHPDERLSANASAARYLEIHERGNLCWWRQKPSLMPRPFVLKSVLSQQCLKNEMARSKYPKRLRNEKGKFVRAEER